MIMQRTPLFMHWLIYIMVCMQALKPKIKLQQ